LLRKQAIYANSAWPFISGYDYCDGYVYCWEGSGEFFVTAQAFI